MINTMNAIASIFTCKGGTLKLAILGSLTAVVIHEILNAHYGLSVTTKDGTISLAPIPSAGIQYIQVNQILDNEGEQEQMPAVVEDDLEVDEPER